MFGIPIADDNVLKRILNAQKMCKHTQEKLIAQRLLHGISFELANNFGAVNVQYWISLH